MPDGKGSLCSQDTPRFTRGVRRIATPGAMHQAAISVNTGHTHRYVWGVWRRCRLVVLRVVALVSPPRGGDTGVVWGTNQDVGGRASVAVRAGFADSRRVHMSRVGRAYGSATTGGAVWDAVHRKHMGGRGPMRAGFTR